MSQNTHRHKKARRLQWCDATAESQKMLATVIIEEDEEGYEKHPVSCVKQRPILRKEMTSEHIRVVDKKAAIIRHQSTKPPTVKCKELEVQAQRQSNVADFLHELHEIGADAPRPKRTEAVAPAKQNPQKENAAVMASSITSTKSRTDSTKNKKPAAPFAEESNVVQHIPLPKKIEPKPARVFICCVYLALISSPKLDSAKICQCRY